MADSSIFKPSTSSAGMGKKKTDDGQFSNPPAYPEVSGFSGPNATKGDSKIMGSLQKTPTAQKGRV